MPDPDLDPMFDAESILDALMQERYFDDGRPEDDVAFDLDDKSLDELSPEERDLYDQRVLPLLKLWFEDEKAFEIEYARTRAMVGASQNGDHR